MLSERVRAHNQNAEQCHGQDVIVDIVNRDRAEGRGARARGQFLFRLQLQLSYYCKHVITNYS